MTRESNTYYADELSALKDIALSAKMCWDGKQLFTSLGESIARLDAVQKNVPPKLKPNSKPVLQDWVQELTFMKQSVLITACRGPDGLPKNHISKVLCRWLRRCFLIRAFEKDSCWNPYEERGGSFTGPCTRENVAYGMVRFGDVFAAHIEWPHGDHRSNEKPLLDVALDYYLESIDQVPHHFHLHLMHTAQILGAYHPDSDVRTWWFNCYHRIVSDAHLNIETLAQMERRLGDNEANWRAAEQVTAK